MSSFRSGVLDRKYIFEYDVGLWTFGSIQVLKDRRTGQLRTCKTVQKNVIRHPVDAMARLQRLRDLQHERLCGVIEVLEDQNRVYVISEKCQGGDVAEWVLRVQEEGNWLQEQTVADYMRQALVAVAHAHGHRVSHRDLRPSSLALTSKLPDAQVKICDFGLAEILDPQDELISRTASAFSAPEVRSGDAPAGLRVMPGAAADMWSLGAIAHMLLVGNPPPAQDSGVAWGSLRSLSRSRSRGELDAWSERSTLSKDFVKKLLKQEAADRPTAAVALQHPWMQACVPLDPQRWNPGSQVFADMQSRLLCYVLAVVVLPELVQYKDLYALRSAFAQADGDHDGFVSGTAALRLLRERGVNQESASMALEVTLVTGTGVADLCSLCAALVIANGFCGQEASAEQQTLSRAAALAPKLLVSFFRLFGDPQRMLGSSTSLLRKLGTAVAREMEVHAGVRYNEIIALLPETGTFDAEELTNRIINGQGRGTPLAPADTQDVREEDIVWAENFRFDGLQDLMKGVFQTCGMSTETRCHVLATPRAEEKKRGYRRIMPPGLGGQ